MTLTCFIYSWELFINNNSPVIIGFGYDLHNNKISIVVEDFPLYKYSETLNIDFKFIQNKKEILSKRLLRHYLDGEKKIYKIYFNYYSDYSSFHSNLFNVDVVSNFLVHQNLDTIGWITSDIYQKNEFHHYTTFTNEYKISYKNIHAKDINYYPMPSILSFDIECMSHDFVSFPNSYLYGDFISTISIVYQYKNIKKNFAICVKYKNGSNIINHCEANEIDSTFISFIDINEFNNACQDNNIFMKNNVVKEKDILTKGINNNKNKNIISIIDHCNCNKEEYSDGKDKMNDNNITKELPIHISKNQKINNDSNSNTNKTNNTNNTINHNDNPAIRNEIENRYHRLKKILNNSHGYNTNTKDRFNRLKNMINNSRNNNKLIENSIKNKNNEKRKEETEPIEEFIKKHEKSKKE
ncbi:hypothetical protein PIROE2DRAFT_18440 [Piromyces sp. E2]|nr:hypothetical protein PIROE2DRAFT_18440 [Piromyces sp. E2]|eukprot:OUM56800.1 hypothetical protein PIROE2DRAFT_18440 [Piromyces sp. E2]